MTRFAIEIGSFDLLVRSGDKESSRAWLDFHRRARIYGQMRSKVVVIADLDRDQQDSELRVANSIFTFVQILI